MDYNAHTSLYDFLSSISKAPGDRPFDAVIDCVGDDTLYQSSPGYLKPDGRYLSIEAGPFGVLKLCRWWPVMFGGTPRAFINVMSYPSGSSAKEVVSWFEKGWIKEIPIDSTFDMGDAIQVSSLETGISLLLLIIPIKAFERLATHRAVGKIFVKVK